MDQALGSLTFGWKGDASKGGKWPLQIAVKLCHLKGVGTCSELASVAVSGIVEQGQAELNESELQVCLT